MDLAQILREYGRDAGIPDLRLGEDGSAELALEGGGSLILQHRPGERALYLRLPLGVREPDDDGLVRLYRRLLEANLLAQRTRGAVFAFDREESMVELQRRLPLARLQTTAELQARVRELLGTARELAGELGLDLDPRDPDATDAAEE